MKIKQTLWAILLVFSLFGFSVSASAEVIKSFDSDIVINKDTVTSVTETIVYDFGAEQKHGIYRDIPVTAENGPQIALDIKNVADELGQQYEFTTFWEGNDLRIRIGDPDTYVTGVKTYVISYDVYIAIRSFTDHDELYWNVTGNNWPVAIEKATASVTLPEQNVADVQRACFAGEQGATGTDCSAVLQGNVVEFASTRPLDVGEGLTTVTGFPLGVVNYDLAPFPPSSAYSREAGSESPAEKYFWILPIFFVALIFFFQFWIMYRKNRKPKPIIPRELKHRAIMAEYNQPDSLAPIEVGTIIDRQVDITDISSVIMDLAVRGYIKIRYVNKEIKFWKDQKDFEFVKLKDGNDLDRPADRTMFDLLFTGRETVTLTQLKQDSTGFQSSINYIKTSTAQDIRAKGYFAPQKPFSLAGMPKLLAAIMISVVMVVVLTALFPVASFISFIIPFFLVAGSQFYILKAHENKLSEKGNEVIAKILGFKHFLEMTEKERLAMLNAPKLEPATFEKFLPYAMVFGVEDQWAKQFEGIYQNMPSWYEDAAMTNFNSHILAHNLLLMDSSFNKVFAITSPRPATGSSSSGFSGGFSGGGSGGGGGGSW